MSKDFIEQKWSNLRKVWLREDAQEPIIAIFRHAYCLGANDVFYRIVDILKGDDDKEKPRQMSELQDELIKFMQEYQAKKCHTEGSA